MYARMGTPDPRIGPDGKIDFRISRQVRSYTRTDRVKPVPITLVIHDFCFAFHGAPSDERQDIANIFCIAFFFCLRPVEYTGTTSDDQLFSLLNDVAFFLGDRKLNNETPSDNDIESAIPQSH